MQSRLAAMFFEILILTVVIVLPVLGTVWAVRDGGHAEPPRSHACDERFGPPAQLLHH